jgi:hypothetical protein
LDGLIDEANWSSLGLVRVQTLQRLPEVGRAINVLKEEPVNNFHVVEELWIAEIHRNNLTRLTEN